MKISFKKLIFSLACVTLLVGQNTYATINKRLLKAITKRNLEKVKKLISKGANVNYENQDQETLLLKATSFYYSGLNIVKFLVKNGAKITQKALDKEEQYNLYIPPTNKSYYLKKTFEFKNRKPIEKINKLYSDLLSQNEDKKYAHLRIILALNETMKKYSYKNSIFHNFYKRIKKYNQVTKAEKIITQALEIPECAIDFGCEFNKFLEKILQNILKNKKRNILLNPKIVQKLTSRLQRNKDFVERAEFLLDID